MIGKVYGIPPQPPVTANTLTLQAGPVVFGVEYRSVDPESLRATYAGNTDQLAELEERSPEGGFSDEGVSIHVSGAIDGWEYLRFDVFDNEPHYHYVHRTVDGSVVNQVIDFDVPANGDVLDWTISRLRTRLAQMLCTAGGEAVALGLDPAVTTLVVDEVERLARAGRENHRSRR
jgi:hypothetical protein